MYQECAIDLTITAKHHAVFRGNISELSGVWVKQRFLRYTKSAKNKRKIDKLDVLKIENSG